MQTHSSLLPQSGSVRNYLHLPSAIFNLPSTFQPTSPGLPGHFRVPGLLGPETSPAMARFISLRGCHSRKAEPLDPGLIRSLCPYLHVVDFCSGCSHGPPHSLKNTHFVDICQFESRYAPFVMMEVRGLLGQSRFLLPVKPDSGRATSPFSFVFFFFKKILFIKVKFM